MGKYSSRKAEIEAKKGDKNFKEIKRQLDKRTKAKKVQEEDIIEEM